MRVVPENADVIVVGSGASGVSVCWPLVEAGVKVLMLDQGNGSDTQSRAYETFAEMRVGADDQWRTFIDTDVKALIGPSEQSPKFRVPEHKHIWQGFKQAYQISATSFHPVGSTAAGGLTGMWGAGAFAYGGLDLQGFPITLSDMAESYVRVAKRIGISGVAHDDLGPFLGDQLPLQPPIELHENARRILARYNEQRDRLRSSGVRLGATRNAVITQDHDGRRSCQYSNMCLWGCSHGSIYGAQQDLARLMMRPNFAYHDRSFVEHIGLHADAGYTVTCRDLNGVLGQRRFSSRVLVLAAGTIASTSLVLKFLDYFDRPVPLASHPAFAMAYFLPMRVGAPMAQKGFALGQLAYVVDDASVPKDYAFGIVFATEGLLASDFARHMPFTRPTAARFTAALMPAMLVANCYLASEHASTTLMLTRNLDFFL